MAIIAVAVAGGAFAVVPRLAVHDASERVRQVDAVTGNAVPVPAASGGAGSAATSNGTVNTQGPGAQVYDYPGGGTTPSTSLPKIGTPLTDGTPVTVQCYLIGAPVTGPNGLGSGGSDFYWDQVDPASTGLAGLAATGTEVIPDADIYTSRAVNHMVPTQVPVNQLVPACGTTASSAGGTGAAGAVGGGVSASAP